MVTFSGRIAASQQFLVAERSARRGRQSRQPADGSGLERKGQRRHERRSDSPARRRNSSFDFFDARARNRGSCAATRKPRKVYSRCAIVPRREGFALPEKCCDLRRRRTRARQPGNWTCQANPAANQPPALLAATVHRDATPLPKTPGDTGNHPAGPAGPPAGRRRPGRRPP